MRARSRKARGVVLAMVLAVMVLVGSMVALLAGSGTRLYRDWRMDRVRLAARTVIESAAEYARAQGPRWAQSQPAEAEARNLDLRGLLPAEMTGTATVTVTVVTVEGHTICHISAQVASGVYTVARELDVPM